MQWLKILFLIINFSVVAAPSGLPEDLLMADFSWEAKWSKVFGEGREKVAIRALLQSLERSPTAKTLLKKSRAKAQTLGKNLEAFIEPGPVSITDSTVVRKFSASNPMALEYVYQLKIYLNRDLSMKDALLDLGHELEHFTNRPVSNPYEKHTTLQEFVQETIEGEGGEGAAVYKECLIAEEIFGAKESAKSSCQLLKRNGEYKWELVVENFYRVGEYFDEFTKHFRLPEGRSPASDIVTNYFPQVSRKTPVFVSSAYGLPYPMAAIFEHMKVQKTVCGNEQKRLKYLKQASSLATSVKREQFSRTIASVESRCP